SIAAGTLAWLKERDLRERKSQIQALPAGATDEWNRQVADAQQVLGARDFWAGVAISVGSVTALLALTGRSSELRRVTPAPEIPAKPHRSWDVWYTPIRQKLSFAWSF